MEGKGDFPVESIGGIIPSNDLELKVLILICWFWKIGRSMAWHVHNVHKNTREASNYLGGSSKPIFIFTPILAEMIQIDKCFSIGWLNHQIARDHQPLPMMSQEWWGVYATEAGTNPQAWCLWRMQVTIHPRNWTTRYPSGNGKIFPPEGTFEDDFIEMFLFQWRDMLVIFGGYPKIGHLWSQNLSPPRPTILGIQSFISRGGGAHVPCKMLELGRVVFYTSTFFLVWVRGKGIILEVGDDQYISTSLIYIVLCKYMYI